jgi:hypothetical protein
MARVIAHVSDGHVRAMLDEAMLSDPERDAELYHTLLLRRDRILSDYLQVRSPLAHFEVERAVFPASGFILRPAGESEASAGTDPGAPSGEWLCFVDLAAQAGVFEAASVRYESRMAFAQGEEAVPAWRRLHTVVGRDGVDRVCLDLAPSGVRPSAGLPDQGLSPTDYALLEVRVIPEPGADPLPPARLHFYDREGFRLVGIERPDR